MIPIKLHLRNFMSYTDVHEPLQFDGIHVACISGDNGHGKSSLLDAITWALWGESRARSADELIHTGEAEMEVEYEFQLGEGRYRVLRKRSRQGRGQTTLDLHAVVDGALRPLSGTSLRETQDKIVEILGMSYDTFINSSYLLQGRADEFTVKAPGERKRILADILELGRYDDYEARARDAAKARDSAAQETERQIAAIDAELAQREAHEAERARLERTRATLELDVTRAQAVLETLRERKAHQDRARADLAAMEARVADGRQQLVRAEEQAAEHRAHIAAYEALLTDAATIDARYARLLALRAEVNALADQAARAQELSDERTRHQRAVDRARGELEANLQNLDKRLPTLQEAVKHRPRLEADLAEAESAATRYDTLLEQRKQHDQALASARGEKAALELANDQLRERFKTLGQNEKKLEEADKCPFCLTPLDAAGRKHAVARCEEERAGLTAEGKSNNARIKALDEQIAAEQAAVATLDAEAAPLASGAGRAGALRQALTQAIQHAAELAGLQAERDTTAARLDSDDYARDAQAALLRLDAELAALAYDPAAHRARRQELTKLEPWEARHRDLERAREALPREQALLAKAEADAAGWRTRLAEDEGRVATLRQELGDPGALERQLGAAEADVRRLEGELRQAHQEYGRVQQILATLEFQQTERARLVVQRDQLQQERGIYGELALAFGKKGIQAMIIESVIPELEEEANALLARMTDNRMHLKLETQRDTRQGNTIETLDIKLADELGTRNYELFSGGEAFRANFALRIALSKLVARRAGAQMQLLVVDEGFGTQDAEGLERLVEAIKAIQDDFEKVLVITHIPEMKEVFPVRIEVRKTPRGSTLQVV
jgi:DNA repair protein SbcC/Rad50